MNSYKDEMLHGCNLIFKKISRDVNGNKTVVVSFPNSSSFSIQTLGNIPTAHKLTKNISDDEFRKISSEVCQYVQEYGSKSQKAKLKIDKMFAEGGTTPSLEEKIAKMEKALNNKSLSDAQRAGFEKAIANAKSKLAESKKEAPKAGKSDIQQKAKTATTGDIEKFSMDHPNYRRLGIEEEMGGANEIVFSVPAGDSGLFKLIKAFEDDVHANFDVHTSMVSEGSWLYLTVNVSPKKAEKDKSEIQSKAKPAAKSKTSPKTKTAPKTKAKTGSGIEAEINKLYNDSPNGYYYNIFPDKEMSTDNKIVFKANAVNSDASGDIDKTPFLEKFQKELKSELGLSSKITTKDGMSYLTIDISKKGSNTKTATNPDSKKEEEPDCDELLTRYKEAKKSRKRAASKPKPTPGQKVEKTMDKVAETIEKNDGKINKTDQNRIKSAIKELLDSIKDNKAMIRELIAELKKLL